MTTKEADNGKITITRKTLSLKSSVDIQAPKTSGKKMLEVEIKRKKHGLAIDIGDAEQTVPADTQTSITEQLSVPELAIHQGTLTDQEFKARLKALQDAKKEEEQKIEVSKLRNKDVELVSEVTTKSETEILETTTDLKSQETVADVQQTTTVVKAQKSFEKKLDIPEPVVFRMSDFDQPKKAATSKFNSPKAVQHPSAPVKEFVESAPVKKGIVGREKSFASTKKTVPSNNKMTRAVINRAINSDFEERERSLASLKRARLKQKSQNKDQQSAIKIVREVSIPDVITVGELANRMAVRSAEVVKYLMSIGTMATINQVIDADTAEVLCVEFGHSPHRVSEADIESELINITDDPSELSSRAPVVAVMGHVDHGKTTLLDTLRKTSVAQKEAGGITQHVAAYQIESKSGKKITFIDTPGHAAFSNIRERGAVITDIIVLVVAADDGIKEQTIEVINQAKAQKVPLVIAINKIDKPDINIERVKNELMTQEIVLEEFGGEILCAEISAKQNINLEGLVDVILLQAEVMELNANKNRKAVGTVLESRVDKGKGVVASVIVQHGTLKPGDIFVSGSAFGKIRTIYDDKGKKILAAGPSSPVEIVGFNSSPEPGAALSVVDNEQKAREIAEYRERLKRNKDLTVKVRTLDQMIAQESDSVKALNLLVKADVSGSLEAIVASVEMITHPEIKVKVIEQGLGVISESDVDFAKNTGAIIIGFNVNTTSAAKDSSRQNGIKILNHSIIYNITRDIKALMSEMLPPIIEEIYSGTADVRKIFTISKFGTIAGCYVIDGIMKRNDSKIKVMRDKKCIFEGKMRSMKHEKDEIKEAKQSHECGILADGFNDFSIGDLIECYEIVQKSRSVD